MAEYLGFGGVTVDLLGTIDGMPGWDETVYLDGFTVQQGGMAATAMVTVARLGGSAEFVGAVGPDVFGVQTLGSFRDTGVDCGRVWTAPSGSTPLSNVLVDRRTGRRTILHHRGVLEAPSLPGLDAGALDLEGVRFLHMDGLLLDSAVELAARARRRGIVVTLDLTGRLFERPERTEELIGYADYLVPSRVWAERYTGEADAFAAAEALLRSGARAVIVTMGGEGSAVVSEERRFRVPAFEVPVVDTTGAGDVFHGGLLYGLGLGLDLERAVVLASAVAALKCTEPGGQAGIPDLEAVRRFLARRGRNVL